MSIHFLKRNESVYGNIFLDTFTKINKQMKFKLKEQTVCYK